jgi:putative NADH-flavin reductase
VFGLVRDAKKSSDSAANEITLIEADITKPSSYSDYVKQADVIIHSASDYTNFDKVDGAITQLCQLAKEGQRNPLVIFTSGIMCYKSNDSDRLLVESDPMAVILFLSLSLSCCFSSFASFFLVVSG